MAAPLALIFGEILLGGILVDRGAKDVKSALAAGGSGSSGAGSSGATSGTTTGTQTTSERDFADLFLSDINAPETPNTLSALYDWWYAEEGSDVLVPGHGGTNNPFEIAGGYGQPTTGTVNSAGVSSFATPQEGALAAEGYFDTYSSLSNVIAAFQHNDSITEIEDAVRNLGPEAFGSDTSTQWERVSGT